MIEIKLIIFFLISGGVVWAIKFFVSARRQQKRRALLSTPFPSEWAAILKRNLPPYQKISPQLQQQLHDYIRIFISEKSFEGCGGLTLTDEIKVTIAAQACLLLEESVRLGESWQHGTVVLAWDSVKRGALNYQDGHNVVMHEFAHQLDQEDGSADGAPILEMLSAYSAWSRTFSEEYEVLQNKALKGRKSVMDKYGATNPAEFFAVATETFFEKPAQLKKKHPELYQELQGFYKVDPAEWEN